MKKHLYLLILLPLFVLPGCEKPKDIGQAPAPAEETASLPPPLAPPLQGGENQIPLVPPLPKGEVEGKNFKFIMGTDFYSSAIPAMPAKGVAFADPDFNTTVVRVTDKTKDGYSGPGIENEYARSDPENSDGTRLVLRGNDGEWYLYSAVDYKLLKHLEITGGGQEPEPRWDAQNPKIFHYLYGMELRAYNIDTDGSTVMRDFSRDIPGAAMITTKTEGDASADRKLWCLMAQDEQAEKTLAVLAYDKSQNKILGKKSSFPDAINWVSADMGGKHCVVGYDEHIAESYSPDFSRKVTLPEKANGHMDLALTTQGRDVMVYQNNATDFIAMADLDSGAETPLLAIPFDINGDIGLHFSGNAAAVPGWALVSTYGSKGLPPENVTHSWMDNQLFMVELKASPRVWRVALTHAFTARNFEGEKNYFAEAFAAVNTRGTRVYFGSNWGNFSTEYSETYGIILPANWQKYIP